MTSYTRPIEMPATKRDGLLNFVQMIVNEIEAGNAREALLKAVDLHQDISSGAYDTAMQDALGANAIAEELTRKHQAEVVKASEAAYLDGIRAERGRVAGLLGLAA